MKVSKSEQQGDSGVLNVGQKFNDELGWIFRPQPIRDLGIDAQTEVVLDGETQGQLLALQIKSGPTWFEEQNDERIVYRGKEKHREYWMDYPLPVMVILHEPVNNIAYWQVVNNGTVVRTGRGWKLEIPRSQTVCASQSEDLRIHCEYPLSADSYSISEQKDVSFGLAKRYSANIILNRSMSKGEIIQVLNHVTEEVSHSNYYRSQLVERHWRKSKAHVVWLFVYNSLDDMKNNNWLCQSQWIDPKLDTQWHPSKLSGTSIGANLVVSWSGDYDMLSKFYRENTVDKEEYLRTIRPMFENMKELVAEIITETNNHETRRTSANKYLRFMKKIEGKVSKLDDSFGNLDFPPIECKDFDSKFKGVMCLARNLVIGFSSQGMKTWDDKGRANLVRRNIRDYTKELPELEYEYKKMT